MSEEDEPKFEGADAGAALVYPAEAGTIRKGGLMMIKGRPCKVIEVSSSKTGKHGHAKGHFVAIDIFTGKKMEELCPMSHNASIPFMQRIEFQLLNVNEDDDNISLLTEAGEPKDDLNLPCQTEEDEKNAKAIREQFMEGKDLMITVQFACGEEKIVSFKERQG